MFQESTESTEIPTKSEKGASISPSNSEIQVNIMEPILSPSYASYYLCDYCPYMCLTETLLTEHVILVHKIKKPSQIYELQCPACPNIFFHKISLESHLTHDHCLKQEDLGKMMQIVLHTKKSTSYTKRDPCYIEKIVTIEKIEQIEVMESSIQQIETSEESILVFDDIFRRQDPISRAGKLLELTHEVNSLTDIKVVNDPVTNEISFIERIDDIGNKTNMYDESIEGDSPSAENTLVDTVPLLKTVHSPNKVNIDMNNTSIANQTLQEITDSNSVPELKYEIPKRMYKCTVDKCRQQMESSNNMQYHVKCHSEDKFACPECDETFSNWNTIVGHLWRAHQVDMELLKCDLCEYRTHSYSKLHNQHRLIHGEEKPYKCDKCEKSFKNNKQMRNHKDVTHREKDLLGLGPPPKFFCDHCDKIFSKRRLLKVHGDNVHKKIKPHQCMFCEFSTSTKGALKMHVRLHTGEKPFKCDFCDYSTADHNSLRRHKLRHSGDKPYNCTHCDYECIQSSTFKMHIKMKHPGLDKKLLFACLLCQFRSVNKEVYNGHVRTHHQEHSETKPSTSIVNKFNVADDETFAEKISDLETKIE